MPKILRLLMATVLTILCCEEVGASSSNTKQYCNPLDLNKYNPTPTSVADKSLSKISDGIVSGVIKGQIADTVTKKFNSSPEEIFTLTTEAVTSLARSMKKPQRIMNTETIIGVPMMETPIVYNRKEIVQKIVNSVLYPIIVNPPSNGSVMFPSSGSSVVASSTSNSSNASVQASTSQNSNELVGQINYSDILQNSLCNKNPTYSSSSTGGLDSTQVFINLAAAEIALNGCKNTMPSSSSSSSSSSSNTTTSTASSSLPSSSGGGSNSSSNLMKNSLQACSAPIGACELFYVQKTIATQVSQLLNDFINNNQNNSVLYSEANTQLNNILMTDLSAYGVNVGMSFPSNCLIASCSGSSCPTTDDVKGQINTMLGYIKELKKKILEINIIKFNGLIDQCESEKQNSNLSYSDQKYFMNNGFTLSQLIQMDSFGVPNLTSSLQCSQKNQYQLATMNAISSDMINKLSQSVEAPSLFSVNIPFDSAILAQGGSFGLVNNQNNISNYGANIPLISNTRVVLEPQITAYQKIYNTVVKNFIAKKSLALQNLRDLLANRSDIIKVPTVLNSLQYEHKCTNGLNSTTSSNDCKFVTPYQNIDTNWNLTAGQECSTAELENMQATWRVRPGPNNSINPWQQKIRYSSASDIAKANIFLLAEIKEQIHINKNLKEKILFTKSSSLITELEEKKSAMYKIIKNMDTALHNYMSGSN